MLYTAQAKRDENLLFFRRLLKNPKALGALAPSSLALSNFICRHVEATPDSYVVEIGAGTGRFTRSLLNNGINPAQLFVVEMDAELCEYLSLHFSQVTVINGDASKLLEILPPHIIGKVSTVISGIPLVNLSATLQAGIADACFAVLAEGGRMLQFTYGPISPLSSRKLGLHKKRLGHVLWNFPPAVIWAYKRGGVDEKKPQIFKRRLRYFRRKMGLKAKPS
ncbi:MAG: phospholipid methyltransferase [Alphaproteobacteria bacterium]|jgi:phosphatidylethanolamine/phosphatidyl-N-methylethanolamine N-methyltransferase|nr:phospholipid methyltransferase [Alphaproteobacteria bacterium]